MAPLRGLLRSSIALCSADAFRVEAVYLCGITATPPNAEIHKTALGGEDSVDWRYFERTEDAIEELNRQSNASQQSPHHRVPSYESLR